ncbi:MAG: hypothetical protein H6Q74_686 [Firmicutes bacterium]|nr:hypothetical protein [Bacillota bacterium]
MTKRIVNGYFSSVPLAQLLTLGAEVESEDSMSEEEQSAESQVDEKIEQ